MEKSASKQWRESGSTLSFKQWIERENQKKDSFSNFLDTSSIDTLLNQQQLVISKNAGIKTPVNLGSNTAGLNTGILMFSTLLIVGSLGFYFYSKLKKE